jgi:hypothetical protein
MTSAFQWIIDKAETISINRKQMVSTTTARDGSIRAVSRGTQPKRFTVKLPDGMRWTDIKDFIVATEAKDRISSDTISISAEGQSWFYTNSGYYSPSIYTVRIVSFPEWTLFARNQVSWSGPFVFVETTS